LHCKGVRGDLGRSLGGQVVPVLFCPLELTREVLSLKGTAMSRTNVNESYTLPGVYRSKSWYTWKDSEPEWYTVQRMAASGQRLRNSVTTPNYTLRARTGTLPQNVFGYTENNVIYQNGYVRNDDRYNRLMERQEGCFSQVALTLPSVSSALKLNLENAAKAKALLKLKDQDVNLIQFYAERAQTARLLRENAEAIGKAYSRLKRGDLAGAAAALGVKPPGSGGFGSKWRNDQSRAIAQGWLSLVYGWRPLIMDAYGSVEHLKKAFGKSSESIRVTNKQSFTDGGTKVTRDGIRTTTYTFSVKVDITATYYYKKSSTVLHELSSLGVTNPAYIAWELTKFSFVVDWFLGVGNWISSLDAALGYTFVDASTTTFSKVSATQSITCHGQYRPNVFRDEELYESNESVSVSRSPSGTGPLPLLPAFKDPGSVEHLLNALALLKTLKR